MLECVRVRTGLCVLRCLFLFPSLFLAFVSRPAFSDVRCTSKDGKCIGSTWISFLFLSIHFIFPPRAYLRCVIGVEDSICVPGRRKPGRKGSVEVLNNVTLALYPRNR